MGLKKNNKLYGARRDGRKENQQLANTLKASSVLGSGEYNYTQDKLRKDVWQTSKSRDFLGYKLNRAHTIGEVTQLNEHFRLGNDSGADVPGSVYRHSTTKDDFVTKHNPQPTVYSLDRTINWPDMAPQYQASTDIGQSEYKNTFAQKSRSCTSAPAFPKVNTAIMTLPLPAKFHLQRGSEYTFGNDERSKVSEHQRSFGRVDAQEDFTSMLAKGDSVEVSKKAKDVERQSNVFRTGDYDGILGNRESTTINDFGPRTRPPGEVFSKGLKSAKSVRSEPAMTRSTTEVPNLLVSYARDVTVPGVWSDAVDHGKTSKTAHFQFGTCTDSLDSVYGKDFMMSAQAARGAPEKAFTKDAGHMLQWDPEFSAAARSLKSSDFMAMPKPLKKVIEDNAGKKYTEHFHISEDPTRHVEERQKSIAHSDYNKHPSNFHALPPYVAKSAPYEYLNTDAALPYPGLDATISENSNQFSGAFMGGITALERRRVKDETIKERADWRKGTHFTVGYAPEAFTSESTHQFNGRRKNDKDVAAAGKVVPKPKEDFLHLSHSLNTQDLRHNDPYRTDTKEGLPARINFIPEEIEGNPFQTSVMKDDFNALNRRSYTMAQVRMLEQDNKLAAKLIENSHFFHTDNSGTDQFRSMTMHDFVQPDEMTGGRKFLAAR